MLNIVLYEPEIPQNTGNIMRTCMAFDCRLHLIGPLGFYLDDRHLRRAGMDYVKDLDYTLYSSWDEFRTRNPGVYYCMTRYGDRSPDEFDYTVSSIDEIYLIFGRESTGIPKNILLEERERCIRIPMVPDARSLNLSNCVSICVYEVMRQFAYPRLSRREVLKGPDFLDSFKSNDSTFSGMGYNMTKK